MEPADSRCPELCLLPRLRSPRFVTRDAASQIDQMLMPQVMMMISAGAGLVFTAGAISFATPVFLAMSVPLAVVYVRIMNYFRQVARELKRLDSITK